MARLNDTRALVDEPYAAGGDHSISVRKIDNGYMVRTSSCDPRTGEYKSAEMFSKNAPRITPPAVGRGTSGPADAANSMGLAGTKKYLGSDV